jgi:predicted transcriptional regulator
MVDHPILPGGKLEYAVLATLWDFGGLTVREVHDRCGGPQGLVYTTTAKVLDRLVGKGLVARSRHGRSFVYQASVLRSEIDLARIRQTLGGLLAREPRPALATVVDAVESINPALLDELARLVETRRNGPR